MLVLGIETATNVCSVSLLQDGTVLYASDVPEPRRHAERLAPMLAEALDAARAVRGATDARRSIDGIAVSSGPGSYTGLRIGVSSAKGIALALGVPIAGVSTLTALAAAATGLTTGQLVVAAIHARADEWYATTCEAQFAHPDEKADAATPVRAIAGPEIVTTRSLVAHLESTSGTLVVPGHTADLAPFNAAKVQRVSPSAIHVARIGIDHLRQGIVENLESFEPTYLRDFVPRSAKRSIFRTA